MYVDRIGRPPAPMEADYDAAIEAGDVWVADDGGDVVGVVVLGTEEDHLSVETVAVARSRQGGGIGSRLLAFAEDRARLRGLTHLRLYTNERMVENLEFYPMRGYIESHRAKSDGFDRVYFVKWL